MDEYVLLFSQYLKNRKYLTYDVIFYNSQFYAGIDLFRNFNNYLANNWSIPVKIINNYNQAKIHFLEYC